MRGFWFTIESTLAISLMLLFIFAMSQGTFTSVEQEDQSVRATQILHDLERQGKLRFWAVSDNTTAIENEIAVFDRSYTIQICDSAGACVGSEPNAANVWVGTYLVSGGTAFDPKEVKLFLY